MLPSVLLERQRIPFVVNNLFVRTLPSKLHIDQFFKFVSIHDLMDYFTTSTLCSLCKSNLGPHFCSWQLFAGKPPWRVTAYQTTVTANNGGGDTLTDHNSQGSVRAIKLSTTIMKLYFFYVWLLCLLCGAIP